MAIEFIRTPEDRFALLPKFPYTSHYVDLLEEFEGLRMHYVDEGDVESENTFLCLHGECT